MTFIPSLLRSQLVIYLAALIMSVAPNWAHAGVQTGKVVSVTVRSSDGLVYFQIDGTPQGKPACATNNYWMIKNENSVAGKQQHATLLAAKLAGKTISIYGLNQCTRWGDGEDVDAITLID